MPNNNPSKLAGLKMPDYSGSWWQLRPENTTTMRVGKWTPVLCQDIAGHSLFKVKPSLRFESLPMVSPLYNGFTMRTKYYFAPYRLYIPELRKNRQLAWGSIPTLRLPQMDLQRTGIANQVSNASATNYGTMRFALPGSLLERLGMAYGDCDTMQSLVNSRYYPPIVTSSASNNFNVRTLLLPLLVYIDSWMYGEYNPQDKNIPVDTDLFTLGGNESNERFYGTTFVSYDNLRKFVDAYAYGESYSPTGSATGVGTKTSTTTDGLTTPIFRLASTSPTNAVHQLAPNYSLFTRVNSTSLSILSSNWSVLQNSVSGVGLLPVTYKGDYFTAWYNEEGINLLTSYVVSSGINMLQLRERNADFMVQLLALVSGNRWVDYLQFIFDTDLELKDHPIMVGYDEVDFGSIDVLSNSQTGEGSTGTLGASASKARMYSHNVKPISFKTKEPGMFMVCSSIVPNVVYYQGFRRLMFNESMADFWSPQYQAKGFMQTLRGEYYSAFSAPRVVKYDATLLDGSSAAVYFEQPTDMNKVGVSYVPLGWNYMKTYSTISGGMRTTMYRPWTLQRRLDFVQGRTFVGDADESVVTPSEFNPFETSGVDYMKSTYVDSSLYNESFANVNRAEAENYVLKFTFEESIYQPLVHQLITKTI